MKTEMAHLQQSAMHNHTAAMLEMGTSLLSQTAEQTRKLTDVETQVEEVTHRGRCFSMFFLPSCEFVIFDKVNETPGFSQTFVLL